MNREHVIYGLFDPRDGELRYVGKSETGIDRRVREHLMPSYLASVSHKNSWLRGLIRDGLCPVGAPIQRLPNTVQLAEAERHWIAHFRAAGCRLTNMTDGGEGAIGVGHSPEARAKRSMKMKGRTIAPEHRAKIAAAMKAYRFTPEQVEKIRSTHLGKPKTKEAIAKTRAANLGRVRSPELRLRMSVARKGLAWTPARRAAQDAKHTNTPKGVEPRS